MELHPSLGRLSSEVASEADRRLRTDIVGWLTTVSSDGTPMSSVISFLWDGQSILFYSQPDTSKLRNILTNPGVSFHLNSDDIGNYMVTLEGACSIDDRAPPSNTIPAYLDKYRLPYQRWGMDPDQTAEDFAVACRIVPTRVRAW
jgi:PPOX class probable F420-dependent enzyme